jgi:acyl-coenzyme A thioesterase 13
LEDFDREVMNNLKLVDAGMDGSVVYEMFIAPSFSNLNSKPADLALCHHR